MKRDVTKVLPPDHQAFSDAIEAMKRYHEARDLGAPSIEVERLRLIAESAYQAATDYQLYALGHQSLKRH